MNVLKTSIFAACIIGVVSCIADMTSSTGSLKKYMKIITAILLVLVVFAPFIGNGFSLDVKSLKKLTDTTSYQKMTDEFKSMYLGMTSDKMEQEIERLIKAENIDVQKVVIQSEYGEYNSLEAKKVTVTEQGLSASDKDKIARIIGENLPDAEVEFAEENSGGY